MHHITPFWDEKFKFSRKGRLDSRVFGARPATPNVPVAFTPMNIAEIFQLSINEKNHILCLRRIPYGPPKALCFRPVRPFVRMCVRSLQRHSPTGLPSTCSLNHHLKWKGLSHSGPNILTWNIRQCSRRILHDYMYMHGSQWDARKSQAIKLFYHSTQYPTVSILELEILFSVTRKPFPLA